MSKYMLWLGMATLLLISGCFWGSTLLFLEKDTVGKTNLLINPHFDKVNSDNPSLPSDWMIMSESPQPFEPVSIDSTLSAAGNKALCIKNSDHDLMILSEAFKVNFSGGYFINFTAKSEKRLVQPLRINFWTYNAAGKPLNKFSARLKPGTDWKKAAISAGFLNNAVTFARVSVSIPRLDNNTVWIDDVSCFQVYQFARE